MGKGEIKSGGEDGLYTIDLVFSTDNYNAEISALDAKIADLTAKYNAFPTTLTPSQEMDKKVVLLTKTSMEKRKSELQSAFTGNRTVDAWCADLTEDLTGVVGTIEVPGESAYINIKPGYTDDAAYDPDADGQLQQLVTMDYAGVFYNLAMLPGWQKWKPTYRYGTISNLDKDNDTCTVTLENISSSQQNLSVNQTNTLTDVIIEYMSCNSKAFEDGDEVLVMFTNQEWSSPKVIGFKENPKPCGEGLLFVEFDDTYCFVWDFSLNNYAEEVTNNTGDPITFPCLSSDISTWMSDYTKTGNELVQATIEENFEEIKGVAVSMTFTDGFPDCPEPDYDGCQSAEGCVCNKDNSESIDLEGWDENGDYNHSCNKYSFFNVKVVQTYYRTEENGYNFSVPTRAVAFPFATPVVVPMETISIETIGLGDNRAFAVAQDYSVNDYWDYFQDPLYNKHEHYTEETNTYTFKSPFTDGTEYEVSLESESQLYAPATGDCSAFIDWNEPRSRRFRVDGIKNDKNLVCFYATQLKTMNTTSDTCGKSAAPSDVSGTPQIAECPPFGFNFSACSTSYSYSYSEGIEYTVKAFYKQDDDPNSVSAFDLPENVQLGQAMVGLKDYAESIEGGPSEAECSDVLFVINFLEQTT